MKLNKKGSVNVLVAMVGGGAGQYVMKKLVPDTVNENLRMGSPALIGLLVVQVSKKPMAEALACGMAGASGAAFTQSKVIEGVMAPDDEEKILLDAFSSVNGNAELEEEIQESLAAAADFNASVAAAADFNASVAGMGDAYTSF